MAGSRANWEDMVMPTLIARDKELIASRRKAESEEKVKAKPAPKAEGKKSIVSDYHERRRKAMEDAGL
jgi:ribosome-binding protein aMBF1 (putative translation factor)